MLDKKQHSLPDTLLHFSLNNFLASSAVGMVTFSRSDGRVTPSGNAFLRSSTFISVTFLAPIAVKEGWNVNY